MTRSRRLSERVICDMTCFCHLSQPVSQALSRAVSNTECARNAERLTNRVPHSITHHCAPLYHSPQSAPLYHSPLSHLLDPHFLHLPSPLLSTCQHLASPRARYEQHQQNQQGNVCLDMLATRVSHACQARDTGLTSHTCLTRDTSYGARHILILWRGRRLSIV